MNRWKRTFRIASLAAFIVLVSTAAMAQTRKYWGYYDASPGLSTVVVLTNASEFSLEEAVIIRLFDAEGALTAESIYGLSSYESSAVLLNDLLPESDELSWGLVEIHSKLLLQIGIWTGTESDWLFVQNYGGMAGDTSGLSVDAYWYGVNYASTQNRRTSLTLLNPSDRVVLGELYLYDAYGALQHHHVLALPARQPYYADVEEFYPVGDDLWGLIDMEVEAPVLIVASYFDAEGYLIDVDVVDQPYFLQLRDSSAEEG